MKQNTGTNGGSRGLQGQHIKVLALLPTGLRADAQPWEAAVMTAPIGSLAQPQLLWHLGREPLDGRSPSLSFSLSAFAFQINKNLGLKNGAIRKAKHSKSSFP